MKARVELAALIAKQRDAFFGLEYAEPATQDIQLADELMAAGWTRPRTITTVEELDALAEGALREASGTYFGSGAFTDCHVRKVPQYIHSSDEAVFEVLCYGSIDVARQLTLPATVLWEPAP